MAAKTTRGPKPRHTPLRSCVACRHGDAKRELVRIVRTPAGNVEIDLTGKVSGRGAYLCRSRSCWELAAKKRALEHALNTTLKPEEKAELERFASKLP